MSHPVYVMHAARRLHASGWKPREITDVLQREHGVRVHPNTVRYWVSEQQTERHRRSDTSNKARARAKASGGRLKSNAKTPQFITERVLALHERGISHRAISVLLEFDLGVHMTAEQIRYLIRTQGASACV